MGSRTPASEAPPYDPPTTPWLAVLHLDRDLLVVDKPSGLLSVPGRRPEHQDSALVRAQAEHPTALVVHRLDMDTSGVLVFALRRKAERALRGQFQARTVGKVYLARVWGHLADDAGVIDLPLAHDTDHPPLSLVCHTSGRPALTRYRVLRRDHRSSLVELRPVTGRSHQLRVHLEALGHPILGDRFYAHAEALEMAPRLQLHASSITLSHPYSGERRVFAAPSPLEDE